MTEHVDLQTNSYGEINQNPYSQFYIG